MRRKDKEITDIKSIEKIIQKSKVCRLGLSLNDTPYIVPVCFGYRAKTLYFHSAQEGKKIDIIKKNKKLLTSSCKTTLIKHFCFLKKI